MLSSRVVWRLISTHLAIRIIQRTKSQDILVRCSLILVILFIISLLSTPLITNGWVELLFQCTDFHPLFSLKDIKYSLKAEYSCTVTSDLSHIPLGFKGNCHQRSSRRNTARKSVEKCLLRFYHSARTWVYRPYRILGVAFALDSSHPASSSQAVNNIYLRQGKR